MRLICPNCAAQYEVDASMIPPEGRDVQCSSCGHTWFQNPDEAEETLADERGVTVRDPSFDAAEPKVNEAPSARPADAPRTRPIDDTAREILRQEAAREAAARRREAAGSLESQPDLGLDDTAGAQSRAAAAKARLARLRQSSEDAAEEQPGAAGSPASPKDEPKATVAHSAGSRRGLLPDIEEINSTLTSTGERNAADTIEDVVQEARSRRGFRFGFMTVLLVVGAMMVLYLFAPQISNAVPAARPALTGYLDWANGVLDTINATLQLAVDAMSGLVATPS